MQLFPPEGMSVKEFYFGGSVSGCSNSTLGEIDRWMKGDASTISYKNAAFGNTVDAMLTQYDQLDMDNISHEDFMAALKVSEIALNDPLCRLLLKRGEAQVILQDEIEVEVNGDAKTVLAKCMIDLLYRKARLAADFKTTAATTMEQFVKQIEMLSYDRQGFWNSNLADDVDTFLIIGLGKKGHGPFIVVLMRDTVEWMTAKEKAFSLAYMWDIYEDSKIFDNEEE